MTISIKHTGKFTDDRKFSAFKINIVCQNIEFIFTVLSKVIKLCSVCDLIGICFGTITDREFFGGVVIPCIRIRKRGCGYHTQAQHKCQQQSKPFSILHVMSLFSVSFCQVLNCDSNILWDAFHFHILRDR